MTTDTSTATARTRRAAGVPVHIDDSLVTSSLRTQSLTRAYTSKLITDVGIVDRLTVLTDASAVQARVRDLQAKLAALGISDISTEGRLVLDGTVEITPGLRRGVATLGTIGTATPVDLNTLPGMFEYTRPGRSVRTVGTAGTDARARSTAGRTLVMLPSLVLDADEALILAEDLQLQDGMELRIANHVKYLTILAMRITTGAGARITWADAPAPARGTLPPAADGFSFQPTIETSASSFTSPSGGNVHPAPGGAAGFGGDDAPTVEIWALEAGRLPAVELQGGPGGGGQRGAAGGAGGHGAKGEHSHATVFCTQGPGYGGDGGFGGRGGDGGTGGRGAAGGTALLYLTDPSHEAVLEAGLTVNLAGGEGGPGGVGGSGGAGGRGGEEGDVSWPCAAAPERAGSDGADGADGSAGQRGASGPTGSLTAVVITAEEFRTKWTAPQIRTVTPWEVEVGDTVTIEGANYTTGAVVSLDGLVVSTTFIADTILQADIPPIEAGWVEVTVDVPGGETSNPASLKVLPSLGSVTPSPAALGATLTITGSGFDPNCHVLFRDLELPPNSVTTDGTSLQVTLPAPQGPFEDLGGTELLSVRNPDGIATAPAELVLRHVLSIGFDVTRHSYAFSNAPTAASGVANMGTFEDTYGTAEVVAQSLLQPAVTGAWYLFYRWFFNQRRPGYSSGFSITAIDEYWSGNPDLFTDHAAMSDVEPLLTVAQGHLLSLELLNDLIAQAAQANRAELSLREVETAFRAHIAQPPEQRLASAPVLQLIPAGLVISPHFLSNVGSSHGLLPIRIEYPVAGESWERRMVLYDNASPEGAGLESFVEYARTGGVLDFVIRHRDVTGVPQPPVTVRDSSNGWTLSHLSLQDAWLNDVTMPLDFVFLLSPATMVVQDSEGRRFGVAGRRSWTDLPEAIPAIGTDNLYLLPLDRDLEISVHGTGEGTYKLGVVAGTLGRSVTLIDVPVGADTHDRVVIGSELGEVSFATGDRAKQLGLVYGVQGVREIRVLAVDGVRAGAGEPVRLTAGRDLSTFQLDAAGPPQQLSLGLSAATAEDMTERRFDNVPVGGNQIAAFRVRDWKVLGPDSLQPG